MPYSARLNESALIIQGWLNDCVSKHGDSTCCSVKGAGPKRLIYLPTTKCEAGRLLDVKPGRLVNVEPGAIPPYVVLSYVWGPPEENLRTLRDNLADMYTTIHDDRLPMTLRQTFDLVRRLKVGSLQVEHLWIDALCIVQNDDADMAGEIANMGLIYRNALLQVAAMASHGAAFGLLPPVRGMLTTEESANHHLIMKACRSLRQSDWDTTLRWDYPLLKRGWPFQERILARRIVHFTRAELVWECRGGRQCECRGIEDGTGDGSARNLINNFSAAFEACVTAGGENRLPLDKVVPMWRESVMSYSKRDLTQEDDRLLAISGIARLLRGPEAEGLYLAGLWRDAMPFDLLWRCDASSGLGPAKTRRPTWSWWSVGCGVDWPSSRSGRRAPPQSTDPHGSLEYIASGTYFERTLKGVPVELVQLDPLNAGFGLVRGGRLEVTARVVDVAVRRNCDGARGTRGHETEWVIEGPNGQVLPFYPDICLPLSGPGTYRFVEIASCDQGVLRWEAGLVVQVAGDGALVFGRVGMAGYIDCHPQTTGESLFSKAEVERVVLV